MKKTFAACFLGVLFTLPSVARADDKQVCADAYKQSQVLKDDHKLVSAREQLRVCSRSECPAFIVKDCAGWLSQVEAAIPSVVLGMKDAAGADVTDAKVSVDGVVIATKLEGRAVDVDSGSHVFVFETADGKRVEQTVIVREGVKNQQVNVVKAGGAATPTQTPATTQNPPNSTGQTPPAQGATPPPAESGGSTLKTVGYVTAGLGGVGLAIGTVFGIIALSQNNSAGCTSADICTNGADRKSAQSSATVSTVSFVAGGVLAVGGLALIIFAPSDSKPETKGENKPLLKTGFRLEASPLVGGGQTGLSLRGAW